MRDQRVVGPREPHAHLLRNLSLLLLASDLKRGGEEPHRLVISLASLRTDDVVAHQSDSLAPTPGPGQPDEQRVDHPGGRPDAVVIHARFVRPQRALHVPGVDARAYQRSRSSVPELNPQTLGKLEHLSRAGQVPGCRVAVHENPDGSFVHRGLVVLLRRGGRLERPQRPR